MSLRLDRAIHAAVEAHAGQLDKAGHPYILHPLRVMAAVRHHGEDAMIAAVLHDVVEDCGVTLGHLAIRFGGTVASAIDAVTRRPDETYRAFVRRATLDPIGRIVKEADLIDNLSRLDELDPAVAVSLGTRYRHALAMVRLGPNTRLRDLEPRAERMTRLEFWEAKHPLLFAIALIPFGIALVLFEPFYLLFLLGRALYRSRS